MADENEAVDNDDPLSIADAIRELWDRAKPNMELTTSQRLEPIDPESAEKYHQLKNAGVKIDRIIAILEQDRQERARTKEGVYRGVKQILKAIFGKD